MKFIPSRRTALGLLAAPALAATLPWRSAFAQNTPASQTVRVFHGYAAGSGPDILARSIVPAFAKNLHQTVLVETKAGAGERLVAAYIAQLPPDGTNLYLMTGGQTVLQATDPEIKYDLNKQFTYLTMIAQYPFILVVAANSPYRTLADLLAAARKNPGRINYSTSGVGTTPHLAMELLCNSAGVSMSHVPYRGNMATDLIGGVLDVSVTTVATIKGLLDDKRLRAIAVTSPARWPTIPDVPAVAETVANYEIVTWMSLVGPAGMSADLVRKTRSAMVDALASPEVKTAIENTGNAVHATTSEELRLRVVADIAKWRKVAKDANFSLKN